MLYNSVLVSAIHQHESAIGIHICPLPLELLSHLPHIPPPRLSESTSLSSLSHTASFHWLSILHMVVYIYMFPWCSLHSSHPLLPLLCPHVCSLHLHPHCCPENRFISTIFLGSVLLLLSHISRVRLCETP